MKDDVRVPCVYGYRQTQTMPNRTSPALGVKRRWNNLQRIYRDPLQTDAVRMRAAIAALPFEHPKLSSNTSLVLNVGFARGLERARELKQGFAEGG
jgi:hypothetical protein